MNEELKNKIKLKNDFDIEDNEEETLKNYNTLSIHDKKV